MHKIVRLGIDNLTVFSMSREGELDNWNIGNLPLREEVFKRENGKKSDKGFNHKIRLDISLFDFMISSIYPNKEVRLDGT